MLLLTYSSYKQNHHLWEINKAVVAVESSTIKAILMFTTRFMITLQSILTKVIHRNISGKITYLVGPFNYSTVGLTNLDLKNDLEISISTETD